jgi:hypothetical protein
MSQNVRSRHASICVNDAFAQNRNRGQQPLKHFHACSTQDTYTLYLVFRGHCIGCVKESGGRSNVIENFIPSFKAQAYNVCKPLSVEAPNDRDMLICSSSHPFSCSRSAHVPAACWPTLCPSAGVLSGLCASPSTSANGFLNTCTQ